MSSQIGSINWGTGPVIHVNFAYDMRRNGPDMEYRVYITIGTVSGASYFGYPIYTSISLDGYSIASGYTIKTASPNRWSTDITYSSAWVTIPNKTSGNVSLSIRLYSGSGSSRDNTYSYTLPVLDYYNPSPISTAGNYYIGDTATINIRSQSPDLRHTIVYDFKGTVGTLATLTDATEVTWNIPMSLCNLLPDDDLEACRIVCDTYSGDTLIGETDTYLNLRVPLSVGLQLTDGWATVAPYNSGTSTEFSDLYISGVSKAEVTFDTSLIDDSQAYGATIASLAISCNGIYTRVYPYRTDVLIDNATITAYVTDTRGRTQSINLPISVYSYFRPTISDIVCYRCNRSGQADDTGTYVYVRATGQYDEIDGTNRMTLRVRYKESSAGTYGSYTNLTSGVGSIIGGGYILANNSYIVEISCIDSLSAPTITTINIGTKSRFFRGIRGGVGAAFGKIPELIDFLDIAWNLKVRKNIYLGTNNNYIHDFLVAHEKRNNWDVKLYDNGYAEIDLNYTLTNIPVTNEVTHGYTGDAIASNTIQYPVVFTSEPVVQLTFTTTNYQIAVPAAVSNGSFASSNRGRYLPPLMLWRPAISTGTSGILHITVKGKI